MDLNFVFPPRTDAEDQLVSCQSTTPSITISSEEASKVRDRDNTFRTLDEPNIFKNSGQHTFTATISTLRHGRKIPLAQPVHDGEPHPLTHAYAASTSTLLTVPEHEEHDEHKDQEKQTKQRTTRLAARARDAAYARQLLTTTAAQLQRARARAGAGASANDDIEETDNETASRRMSFPSGISIGNITERPQTLSHSRTVSTWSTLAPSIMTPTGVPTPTGTVTGAGTPKKREKFTPLRRPRRRAQSQAAADNNSMITTGWRKGHRRGLSHHGLMSPPPAPPPTPASAGAFQHRRNRSSLARIFMLPFSSARVAKEVEGGKAEVKVPMPLVSAAVREAREREGWDYFLGGGWVGVDDDVCDVHDGEERAAGGVEDEEGEAKEEWHLGVRGRMRVCGADLADEYEEGDGEEEER